MSLILEALRKLDRDKDAPERGFVVMTHMPWARGHGSRSRLLGTALLALALAVTALAVVLWRSRSVAPAPVVGSAAPSARAPFEAVPSPSLAARRPIPGETRPRPASLPRDVTPLALAAPEKAPSLPASGAAVHVATPTPPTAELHLNAISRQNGQPVAILNDRLVREGDGFDGIRVLRIGETEVEVEVRGQRRVITF